MLISTHDISRYWGLAAPPRIVHVGAHVAEELEAYESVGWGRESTVWVEALPAQADIVRNKLSGLPHHWVIEAVAWAQSGDTVRFSVADNVQSSSALEFAEHLSVHPQVKVVDTIQLVTTALNDLDIWSGRRDTFLNLDIQGAELSALRELGDRIHECVAIYTEVNLRELYRDVPRIGELDAFLGQRGFWRADQQTYSEYGWGDALYLPAGPPYDSRHIRRLWRKAAQWPIAHWLSGRIASVRRAPARLLQRAKMSSHPEGRR